MKSLYESISDNQNIKTAIAAIAKNKGSTTAGVDGKTKLDYVDIDMFATEIAKRLSYYKAGAVRRVLIPKTGSNKMRPLGIPNYIDRVIQQSIKQVIEPIIDPQFHSKSYRFRVTYSAENAIADLSRLVNKTKSFHAASVDIKGFFDNVDHKILMKQLKERGIKCKKTLALIRTILQADIVEADGTKFKPTSGTPQGGVLSPLLSNVVLNNLDWLIDKQ